MQFYYLKPQQHLFTIPRIQPSEARYSYFYYGNLLYLKCNIDIGPLYKLAIYLLQEMNHK